MLAASAETLPRGHALIEPYIFDVRTARSNHLGSLTYLLYGVTDGFSVGTIATAGRVVPRDRARSSSSGAGDTTLLAQYRLTEFGQHGWPATLTLVLQEGLPTGRFDQLPNPDEPALGSGARTTQLALYAQSLVSLPNGRLLRLRVDAGHTFASVARPMGRSIYQTPAGFHGRVARGPSEIVDGSLEYSVSKRTALAVDLVWQKSGSARVVGQIQAPAGASPYHSTLAPTEAVYFAPAVEYCWRPNLGILFAMRLSPKGKNSPPSATPAIALNLVL
jgi:hypothetical protein